MRTAARKRRRWPLVVAALGAAAVLGGGAAAVVVLAGDGDQATPAGTAAPVATPDVVSEGNADGCLAGADITSAALLRARAAAPLDETGAAAFAADLFRWLGTDPTPEEADELAATIDQVLASTASDDLRSTFAQAVDQARQGMSADDWSVSTVDARYYVESSTSEGTVVSVAATRVFDDGTRQSGTQTFSLVASPEGWQLASLDQMRSTPDLQSIGTSYTEGC